MDCFSSQLLEWNGNPFQYVYLLTKPRTTCNICRCLTIKQHNHRVLVSRPSYFITLCIHMSYSTMLGLNTRSGHSILLLTFLGYQITSHKSVICTNRLPVRFRIDLMSIWRIENIKFGMLLIQNIHSNCSF